MIIHGKTSPTQTKVHSEQCPGLLMEAAQLVSKALHGPRELLPLHHLEALEDSSQKAVTCREGNLQDYPEGWSTKSMQIEQSHTLGQRNTLAYTIAMFQFDHYAVLKYRIHPSATFPVCALVEFSPRQSWIC